MIGWWLKNKTEPFKVAVKGRRCCPVPFYAILYSPFLLVSIIWFEEACAKLHLQPAVNRLNVPLSNDVPLLVQQPIIMPAARTW
jgi:hypothetical protein